MLNNRSTVHKDTTKERDAHRVIAILLHTVQKVVHRVSF